MHHFASLRPGTDIGCREPVHGLAYKAKLPNEAAAELLAGRRLLLVVHRRSPPPRMLASDHVRSIIYDCEIATIIQSKIVYRAAMWLESGMGWIK